MKNSNRVVDILARYGGEEFLMILPQTNLGGAQAVAERYREMVEEARMIQSDKDRKITVSLGASAYAKKQIGSKESLLKQADEALYEAKRQGKNRVVTFNLPK